MSLVDRFHKFCRLAFILITLFVWPLVFVLSFQSSTLFSKPETIFTFDYQARQQVIRNTYAYPTVWLARIFQNKAHIPLGKFEHNLTALIDPNNYFFGFHPREILDGNRNAVKFPFVALPVFLLGLFTLSSHRYSKQILATLAILIVSLSFLINFDEYDFLLYFPMSLVFLSGLGSTPRWFFSVALPFAVIDLLRQIAIFIPK